MVRDEADAEHDDQHQHVPAWLGQFVGAGGRRLPLLYLRQPAGGAVVEEDQGDEDKQEDGGGAGVDDFVEDAELWTVQDFAADRDRHRGEWLLGEEGQDDVAARRGQKEDPGYRGDDASDSYGLQDVSS